MNLYLKWTRTGRIPAIQGGTPIQYRKWTAPAEPILCQSGWHACRWEDAVHHICDELWICELRGPIVEGADKVVGESLRLVRKVSTINERTLRHFAADCAEDVLHLFERDYPNDDRPRRAIEAARLFADGKITAAAWDAAGAAARAAARDAARDAARAVAGAAARAATWDAAWDAARYGARDAARAATWDAARAATRDAARAVAGAAQTTRLLTVYAGLDPANFAHRGQS